MVWVIQIECIELQIKIHRNRDFQVDYSYLKWILHINPPCFGGALPDPSRKIVGLAELHLHVGGGIAHDLLPSFFGGWLWEGYGELIHIHECYMLEDYLSVCPSVRLSVFLYLYLYLSLSLSLSIYLSVCLSTYLSTYLPIYLSVNLSVYLSICLSVCLSVRPSVCLYLYLSLSLPLYLSICLSVYLPTYLSIHPSIHPSIYRSIDLI